MSIHAAALQSQPSPSMTDSSGCDITKPAPIERGLDAQLDAFRREWHAVARYMITLSKDGDWNDTTTVAEWLPYDEAVRLKDKLNAARVTVRIDQIPHGRRSMIFHVRQVLFVRDVVNICARRFVFYCLAHRQFLANPPIPGDIERSITVMSKQMMRRLRGDAFQARGQFHPDRLIAPLLDALWAANIETRGCCHGHIRHGFITTPYASLKDSETCRRFMSRVARWRWALLLPWEGIESDYEGQKWISLSAPNWKRVFLPSSRRHYRKSLAWDVFVLRLLAKSNSLRTLPFRRLILVSYQRIQAPVYPVGEVR